MKERYHCDLNFNHNQNINQYNNNQNINNQNINNQYNNKPNSNHKKNSDSNINYLYYNS